MFLWLTLSATNAVRVHSLSNTNRVGNKTNRNYTVPLSPTHTVHSNSKSIITGRMKNHKLITLARPNKTPVLQASSLNTLLSIKIKIKKKLSKRIKTNSDWRTRREQNEMFYRMDKSHIKRWETKFAWNFHNGYVSFLLRRFSSAIKLGFQDSLSRHTAYTYKSRNCVDNIRHQLLFHLWVLLSNERSRISSCKLTFSLFCRFKP